MEHDEISGGASVKASVCTGGAVLGNICSSAEGLEASCTKPENLYVCGSEENLSSKTSSLSPESLPHVKGSAGGVCCGGGTLEIQEGGGFGTDKCTGDTSLCEGNDKLTIKPNK
jgi:hypothetical protein